MSERMQQPIQPESRPMGPLLEGDQAVIDAVEQIPMGEYIGRRKHDGHQVAETVRRQSGANHPLPPTHTVNASEKKYGPKVSVEITPDGVAVADDSAGLMWLGEDNRLSRVDADSEPIVTTKEAQDLKMSVAKKIAGMVDKMDAADEVDDNTRKHRLERIAMQPRDSYEARSIDRAYRRARTRSR